MTNLLSVRVKPPLFAAIQERSAELRQNRSQYVLSLIERDLEEARRRRERSFVSEDLIGSLRTGIPCGDNATIREEVRRRLDAKNR